MGVVYRYIDLNDNEIKYVGIVWSGNRTLKQRVEEHYKNDSWCDKGHWRIEYVLRDVNTRTDAEYLEAHYTNKFRNPNGEWFGKTKLNWGESEIIDDSNDNWEVYSTDEKSKSDFSKSFNSFELMFYDDDKPLDKTPMYEMNFYSNDKIETVYVYPDSALALKENHSIFLHGGCTSFIMWLMYVTCIRKGRETGLVGENDLFECMACLSPGGDSFELYSGRDEADIKLVYSEIDYSIKEIIIDDISIEIGDECFYAGFDDITKFSNDKSIFSCKLSSNEKIESVEELYKEFNFAIITSMEKQQLSKG